MDKIQETLYYRRPQNDRVAQTISEPFGILISYSHFSLVLDERIQGIYEIPADFALFYYYGSC